MSVVNGGTLKNFLRLLFQNKMGVCLENPFILDMLISSLKSHFSLMVSSQLRASLVAQSVKNLPSMQETLVRFLGWEDLLEKKQLLTPVFWPGEFHGLYSPSMGKYNFFPP